MNDMGKKILEALENGNVFNTINEIQSEALATAVCPMCGKPVDHAGFKNELSEREAGISGLCQVCQDQVFPDDETSQM